MKARVYHCGLWYGEVYSDNWMFGEAGWRDVTEGHLTKLGATIALKHWIYKNTVYEVEV